MFSGLSIFEIAVVLVSIILSMAVHEAMHGFVAHWLGDDTAEQAGRLTLNPLKHIDIYTTVLLPIVLILSGLPPFFAAKPVPFNPARVKFDEYGSALIGVAGPLTNLVLAVLAAGIFRIWGVHQSSTIYNIIVLFTEVNIGFFIFNMIPFPPLDGSRVLYAFAPEPVQEIMLRIEQMGFTAIIIFMLIIFRFISGPVVHIESIILQFLLGN
jgi:Zn-dependent protease